MVCDSWKTDEDWQVQNRLQREIIIVFCILKYVDHFLKAVIVSEVIHEVHEFSWRALEVPRYDVDSSETLFRLNLVIIVFFKVNFFYDGLLARLSLELLDPWWIDRNPLIKLVDKLTNW